MVGAMEALKKASDDTSERKPFSSLPEKKTAVSGEYFAELLSDELM